MSDAAPREDDPPVPLPPSYAEPEGMDLLSEILAQLTEGVVTLTAEGTVLSWNAGASSLTGYTLAEITKIGLFQLFDTPEEMTRLIQQVTTGRSTLDARLVLTRADGQRIAIDVRCSLLRHLGKTPARIVLVMRDLSELEALQKRLFQSERLNMLGRLAGVISHEIRNPLTAIFLHADVLEDELQLLREGASAQLRRSLHAIKDEVTHLHDLVQQYLSLARLSALRCEPVELGSYIENLEEELLAQLATHNVTLRLEKPLVAVHVALHRSSFRRVLLNLVNNAIEAMPQGGELSLHVEPLGERVHIAIRDTGCGIPEEQLPLLFSPFHTTKTEGTGLGLYLVQEIVAAHQGEITVKSTPGMGTTFTMTLPVLASQESYLALEKVSSNG